MFAPAVAALLAASLSHAAVIIPTGGELRAAAAASSAGSTGEDNTIVLPAEYGSFLVDAEARASVLVGYPPPSYEVWPVSEGWASADISATGGIQIGARAEGGTYIVDVLAPDALSSAIFSGRIGFDLTETTALDWNWGWGPAYSYYSYTSETTLTSGTQTIVNCAGYRGGCNVDNGQRLVLGPGHYELSFRGWTEYEAGLVPAVNLAVSLTPVPIPGAAWLLGSGLLCGFAMSARSRLSWLRGSVGAFAR
jgi:hypothetical protein